MSTLLSRKEAAARLRISEDKLDMERNEGYLSFIQRKPGGKVWITEEAITEYLERATHTAKPVIHHSGTTYRKRRG